MKKELFFISLISLFFSLESNSQTMAITIHGDTIYVHDNGTWSFEILEESPEVSESGFLNEEVSVDTIKKEFVYSKNTNKELKNALDHFKVKYNSEKWKREPPAAFNEDAEFALSSKINDLWCIIISEETEIEPLSLFNLTKNMMEENTGAKVKTKKVELRKVNGKEVIRGVLDADISGINMTFDSYYYSDESGSVQFIIWTGNKLWDKYEDEILDLLNGFIVLDKK